MVPEPGGHDRNADDLSGRDPAPAGRVIALATRCALVAVASVPAQAQRGGSGPPLIRDAEIEQLLKEYTQPILQGGRPGPAEHPASSSSTTAAFNAFVADGRRIFVNAGALMEAQTPNQIIGVLAHETGHIAGGHLARIREQLANGVDPDDPRHDARRGRDDRRRRAAAAPGWAMPAPR